MNSKIALNKLIHCCLFKEELDVESQYSADELKSIVAKDLELLEIFKKLFIENIYENDDAVYSDIMIKKDSDEYAKIKEYLISI